ncbi:MAG: hypothetical protein AMXMBFR36_37110 [Acidobacteriota bacterium]
MAAEFAVHEAKVRFSELLRRVRRGERVVITWHGKPIAELRPHDPTVESLDERWQRLAAEGRIAPAVAGATTLGLRPVARRPGALGRFLSERD